MRALRRSWAVDRELEGQRTLVHAESVYAHYDLPVCTAALARLPRVFYAAEALASKGLRFKRKV